MRYFVRLKHDILVSFGVIISVALILIAILPALGVTAEFLASAADETEASEESGDSDDGVATAAAGDNNSGGNTGNNSGGNSGNNSGGNSGNNSGGNQNESTTSSTTSPNSSTTSITTTTTTISSETTTSSSSDTSTNAELDISAYRTISVLYWDMDDPYEEIYEDETQYIESVYLNGIEVVWAESSEGIDAGVTTDNGYSVDGDESGAGDFSWATDITGYSLKTYMPEEDTDGQYYGNEYKIVVTPVSGYYVTEIMIVCSAYPAENTRITPYNCSTYNADNNWETSLTLSDLSGGAVSATITALDVSHNGYNYYTNDEDNPPIYFILITVEEITDVYVEYSYGEIVDIITAAGDSYDSSAFSTANGWTTASSANVYTPNDSSTDGGVQTSDVQFLYTRDSGSGEDTSEWVHYTNTITDSARLQAAAVGYVFAGWLVVAYGSCDATQNSSTSEYEDGYYIYTYDFDDLVGSGMAAEDVEVLMSYNYQIIAQWVPVGVTVTKTVTGDLPDGTYSYTIQLQEYVDGEWTEVETFTYSITISNGTGTLTYVYYTVTAGTYRIVETVGTGDKTISNTTYYWSSSQTGTLSLTASYIAGITYSSDGYFYDSSGNLLSTYTTTDDDGDSVTVVLIEEFSYVNSYSTELYTLKLNKYDSNQILLLSGAEFILYYYDDDGNCYYYVEETDDDGNVTVTWSTDVEDATVVTTDSSGAAQFVNLTAGTYYLEEIAAPDGYELPTPNPIVVEIGAESSVATEIYSNVFGVTQDSDDSTITTLSILNEEYIYLLDSLPTTGGNAPMIVFAGMMLTMTGVALGVIYIRRRRFPHPSP